VPCPLGDAENLGHRVSTIFIQIARSRKGQKSSTERNDPTSCTPDLAQKLLKRLAEDFKDPDSMYYPKNLE